MAQKLPIKTNFNANTKWTDKQGKCKIKRNENHLRLSLIIVDFMSYFLLFREIIVLWRLCSVTQLNEPWTKVNNFYVNWMWVCGLLSKNVRNCFWPKTSVITSNLGDPFWICDLFKITVINGRCVKMDIISFVF